MLLHFRQWVVKLLLINAELINIGILLLSLTAGFSGLVHQKPTNILSVLGLKHPTAVLELSTLTAEKVAHREANLQLQF